MNKDSVFLCEGCGAGLLSGDTVRWDTVRKEQVGCERCTSWANVYDSEICPNEGCESTLECDDMALLDSSGNTIMCGYCTEDRFASDVCKQLE